jgi:hypothetical protein
MTARYDELYTDLCASIVKYCVDKINVLDATYPELQFLDWDAHGEMRELPDKDLLGPAGVGMVQEDNTFEVTFSIGVSTRNDRSLNRLRRLVSNIYADLRPQQKLHMYRLATAVAGTPPTPLGWLVCQSPCLITPITRAETRAFQFVQLRGLLDPKLPFAA